MSGVIDEHGQWEHCAKCNRFVLIQNLRNDLCVMCAPKPKVGDRITFFLRSEGHNIYADVTKVNRKTVDATGVTNQMLYRVEFLALRVFRTAETK